LAGRVLSPQRRGERDFINKITMLEGFLKIPRPAWLRERASGAAVAVFFATAVTRG
jgi:hypothetical protein